MVVGQPAVASPSPVAGSIAWVVLKAASHTGDGLMARVAYVTRTDTVGGVAPMDGCDAAHAGTEVRVPYSATYTFFPG